MGSREARRAVEHAFLIAASFRSCNWRPEAES